MADIGWKFGADIKQEDGHYKPSTCYVAVADHEAARQTLSDAHPDVVFHGNQGERVSGDEWNRTFEVEPEPKEIRLT